MKLISSLRLFLISIIIALVTGCSDESDNYFDEENITVDAATGTMEAYDVFEMDYLAETFIKSYKSNPLYNGCTLFTDSASIKRLTLDFGSSCKDPQFLWLNRARSGKIIVNYPTVIGDTIAGRSFSFINYTVGGKHLEGELALENVFFDQVKSQIHSTCRFKDFKVSFPDGTIATFNGAQSRLWTAGRGNKVANDNTYLITRIDPVTGFTPSGLTFTVNITSPIFANFSCAVDGSFAGKSGRVEVTNISGYPDRERNVNFGSDLCDKIVTVTTYRRTWSLSVE